MLVRLFKNIHPGPMFMVLPLLALGLWLPGIPPGPVAYSPHQMPLFVPVARLAQAFPFTLYIAFSLVVWLQGVLLNFIADKHEINIRKNNLPGLIYVVLMSSFSAFLQVHPVILANLFLILMLRRMISIYRQQSVFSQAFDSGALVAVASLFYFPAVFIFPFVLLTFALLRPFIWREYVIAVIGLIFPYLFAGAFYFVTDRLELLWYDKMLFSIDDSILHFRQLPPAHLNLLITLGFFLLLALTVAIIPAVNFPVKVKNYLRALVVYVLAAIAAVVVAGNQPVHSYALLMPAFAILFANYLVTVKKGWVAEAMLLIILGAIFTSISTD